MRNAKYSVGLSLVLATLTSLPFSSGQSASNLGPRASRPARNRIATPSVPRFIYTLSGDNTLTCYAVDPTNGQLRPMRYQTPINAAGPAFIGVTASNKFVYVADVLSSTVSGYAISEYYLFAGAGSENPGFFGGNVSGFVSTDFSSSASQGLALEGTAGRSAGGVGVYLNFSSLTSCADSLRKGDQN
jgi:hypothetical protein